MNAPAKSKRKEPFGPHDEVVGVQVGTTIYRDLDIIIPLIESGQAFDLITRARMQFMAACDLGPKWKQWAEASTLFYYRDGKYSWPNKVWTIPNAVGQRES